MVSSQFRIKFRIKSEIKPKEVMMNWKREGSGIMLRLETLVGGSSIPAVWEEEGWCRRPRQSLAEPGVPCWTY